MNKTAIIVGASGLVGSALLKQLLQDQRYTKLIVLVRRPLLLKHPKLIEQVVDFSNQVQLAQYLHGDDLFICTGTTIKIAGSKVIFKQIDYDLPLRVATIAAKNEVTQLLLISALGANSKSKIFYSKIKGELEQAIGLLPFKTIHIFQPSILLGHRAQPRPLEKAFQYFMDTVGSLMKGALYNYKGIPHHQLAKAMIYYAAGKFNGVHFWKGKSLFVLD